MKHKLALALVSVAALAGCAATTTANAPSEFAVQQSGTYELARQALFVDCVFDGFLGVQNAAMATHVRQVKRANGWRIDVIAESRQFLVADITDDGRYLLRKTENPVPLGKEVAASRSCLERFGRVDQSAPGAPR